MANKECSKCIHNAVCKTAESCDGYGIGCKHFKEQKQVRMDVREKLVELIDDFIYNVDLKHWYSEELDEKLADDLIANGVTVQGDKDTNVLTNADRIRAMSDEELANWLARTQYANMMEAAEIFGEQIPFEEETLKGSEQECLQWLKQPADMRGEEE